MSGAWLFLLAVAAVCSAQELPAGCPQKMAMKDFNKTAYMGKWYEYAKFGYTPYEEGGLCVTAEYSLMGDNVTVVNGMLDNKTRESVSKTAVAVFQDESGDAKLSVHFQGAPVGRMYWVLNTDYHNFSIVWACTEQQRTSNVTETSWILLRTNISNETKDKLEEALQKVDLPLSKYTMTEQSEEVCGGTPRLFATSVSLLLAVLVALLR